MRAEIPEDLIVLLLNGINDPHGRHEQTKGARKSTSSLDKKVININENSVKTDVWTDGMD